MADPRFGVAVLAAGASRRFGEDDKLAAQVKGRRLGEYAVTAIPGERFARRWVIAAATDHPCEAAWRRSGFGVILNPRAEQGMGTSVAAAAEAAIQHDCDALLIALADMPLVPTKHFTALVDQWDGAGDIVASRSGDAAMPPAIFGSDHLKRLARSRGDEGARRWLGEARSIRAPSDWLIDIDTPEALAALR